MIRLMSAFFFLRFQRLALARRRAWAAATTVAGITMAVSACAGSAIQRQLPHDTPVFSKDTAATTDRVPAVHQVTVPAGRIGGIVLVRTTLQPAVRAMTFLDGSKTGDYTDSTGAFLLPDASPGTHTLVIRGLGCVSETLRVLVTPDQGTAVVVLLGSSPHELSRMGLTRPDPEPIPERVCPR